MRFKVMGADGSNFIVQITASTPAGQYVTGSARSAGGELIPEETSQIKNGTWTGGSTGYRSGALDSMVDHFDRLGATIQFIGGGGGGAIATTIVCDEQTCYVYLENPR